MNKEFSDFWNKRRERLKEKIKETEKEEQELFIAIHDLKNFNNFMNDKSVKFDNIKHYYAGSEYSLNNKNIEISATINHDFSIIYYIYVVDIEKRFFYKEYSEFKSSFNTMIVALEKDGVL